MWHLAAESLSRFSEVIVTAVSEAGYPVSVRQRSPRYDSRSGEMPVLIPKSLAAAPGPANVLAHYHDEKLANLQVVQIKGILETRYGDWIFVSTAFRPSARGRLKSLRGMAKAMRRSSLRYLDTRGLRRPKVNWVAINSLQQQAQRDRRRSQARSGRAG